MARTGATNWLVCARLATTDLCDVHPRCLHWVMVIGNAGQLVAGACPFAPAGSAASIGLVRVVYWTNHTAWMQQQTMQ